MGKPRVYFFTNSIIASATARSLMSGRTRRGGCDNVFVKKKAFKKYIVFYNCLQCSRVGNYS